MKAASQKIVVSSSHNNILELVKQQLPGNYDIYQVSKLMDAESYIKSHIIDCLLFCPENAYYYWNDLQYLKEKYPYIPFISVFKKADFMLSHKLGQSGIKYVIAIEDLPGIKKLLHEVIHCAYCEFDFSVFGIEENRCSDIVKKFLNKLKNEYLEVNNISQLSNAMGLTRQHLANEIKKYTSYSPKKMLSILKITFSIRLMRNPGFKLKEIAAFVHYDNPRRFYDLFVNTTGISPKKFREFVNKKNDDDILKYIVDYNRISI